MKIRNHVLFMALTAGLGISPLAARAAIDFSIGLQVSSPADFTQPLSPDGEWVNAGTYGRCWHPTRVDRDWRPYTVGSWEWTDAGWYWQSDEPWAPECYHYGSWEDDPTYGWVWIPGTEWAPAWVTWRSSDDYIGWAPCGPGMAVLPAVDFVFADVHNFHDHRFNGRRDFRMNDTTIINRTRVIQNFSHQTVNFNGREQRIVTNPGPGAEAIQRVTRTPLQARPIRDVIQRNARPQNMDQRNVTQPRQPQREQQNQQFQQPQRDQQQRDQQQRNLQQEQQPRPTPLQPTGRENGNLRPNQQPSEQQQRQSEQQRQPQQQRPTEQRQIEQRSQQQQQQPRPQSQVVPEPRSPSRPAPNDNPNPPVPVRPRPPQTPAPLPPTGRSENGTPLRPPQQPEQRQPQQQPKEQPKAQPQQRQPEQKPPQEQQKKERDNSKDSAVKVNWKALV